MCVCVCEREAGGEFSRRRLFGASPFKADYFSAEIIVNPEASSIYAAGESCCISP